MMREEFTRLLLMYEQAVEGKGSSVQEIFQQSLNFIELLKEQIKEGDEEDRQAAIRTMNELYQKMKDFAKTMSEKSGVTEEQFVEDAENPANYTPAQWKSVQESKNKIAKAGNELINLLQPKKPQEKAPVPESLISKSSPEQKALRKKAKKSQWMRS